MYLIIPFLRQNVDLEKIKYIGENKLWIFEKENHCLALFSHFRIFSEH